MKNFLKHIGKLTVDFINSFFAAYLFVVNIPYLGWSWFLSKFVYKKQKNVFEILIEAEDVVADMYRDAEISKEKKEKLISEFRIRFHKLNAEFSNRIDSLEKEELEKSNELIKEFLIGKEE